MVTSKDKEEWKISRLPVISDASGLGSGRNGEKEKCGIRLSGSIVQWKGKGLNEYLFTIEVVMKDI